MPLRLAILNTWGGARGGAARAVYRLHSELRAQGVDSTLLAVAELPSNDPSVVRLPDVGRRLSRWLEKAAFRGLPRPWPEMSLNRISRVRAWRHPAVRAADVVLLGWIGQSFLSPGQLARLQKPLVWRLSDCWPFTGGCHYPGSCRGFEGQCGLCPLLGGKQEEDPSRRLWRRKQEAFARMRLTIAAPSRWILELAKTSSLFRGRSVHLLPSGVDMRVFRPLDRKASREALGLPADRTVLLFGAINSTQNPRKGFTQLIDALRLLGQPPGPELHLAIFGNRPGPAAHLPYPATYLGDVDQDTDLARIYSAADLFVAPSLEENLPNTVMEAMACGLPAVGFARGGMPDLISEGRTGSLASSPDAPALAEALRRAISHTDRWSPFCREWIGERFSLERQALAYRNLLEAQSQPGAA